MEIQAIWEGQLPLENIVWDKQLNYEFRLPRELDSQRDANWNQFLKANPKAYDGKLLFLRNFEFKGDNLALKVGYVRFSTIVFMEEKKLTVEGGSGVLGVQCLIFSPCNHYILVGERLLSEPYCPGLTTVPGGMLELTDLENKPSVALMREVHEEVFLPLQPKVTLRSIFSDRSHVSAGFLISSTLDDSYKFDSHQCIQGEGDEWEDNLRWISVEQILELPDDTLYDGLIYFKSKLMENKWI